MKNNYCLPVIKESESEVLAELKAYEAIYSYFEIWLDYIEDLRGEFVSILQEEYAGRLVFVFRRKNLEKPKLRDDEQLDIIKGLENLDCFVDMDVYDQKLLIEKSAGLRTKRIVSYHNYKKTPSEDELNKIIKDIESASPEIIKISTFCNSKTDALVLLKIMLEMKAEGKKHIILGMGVDGLATRLYGALWGNELTFITEKKEDASAPGQLTRAEYEKFLKEGLNGRQ